MRYLINITTVLSSALLLLTITASMARTQRQPHTLRVPAHSHAVWLHAEDVGARLVVRSYLADRQTTERFLGPGWDVPFTERVKPNSLGFGTGSIGRLSGPTTPPVLLYRDQHLLAPWWFLMLASAALPAARMTRVIAQRRTAAAKLREGRCLRCGYDLRATPDRCPECGARSAAPTAA